MVKSPTPELARRQIVQASIGVWMSAALPSPASADIADWIGHAKDSLGLRRTLRILLLDISLSSAPKGKSADGLYLQSVSKFLMRSREGDAIAMATAGSGGASDQRVTQRVLPRSGEEFKDRAARGKVLAEVQSLAKDALEQPKQARSRLLEGLAGLQPVAHAGIAAGMDLEFLYCTDAREDSDLACFDKAADRSEPRQAALLENLRRKQMLLTRPAEMPPGGKALGAMSIVGVGGSDVDGYVAIRRFWQQYCAACRLELRHYGSDLPEWAG